MMPLSRSARVWIVVVGVIVLIAAHGVVFYAISSHVALSTTVVGTVIILLIAKHLGVLGPRYGAFGRRSRRSP